MSENTEIFERLRNIEALIARIDERTARMDREMNEHHADHEKRIRALEDKEARRGGVIAALTTIGSAVGAAITWLVHHVTAGGGAQ